MPNPRPSNEDRVRAALWFAERGFGVFSVWSTNDEGVCRCGRRSACDSPGKHPIPANGFLDATTDPKRITTFLSHASSPNYGLLPPDGVFVLDVDGEGIGQLAELEQRLGPLPPTLRTHTAHGQHVFLHWPDAYPRPIGQLFGFVTRWGSGKNAGYIIGPRSVHASGAEYRPDEQFLGISTLPDAWAQAAVQKPDPGTITIGGLGYELPESVAAGQRYEAIRAYTAHLYNSRLSREEMWPLVRDILAPRFAEPLTEPELRARFERTTQDLATRLGPPRLGDALPEAGFSPTVPGAWPSPPAPEAFHGVAGEIVRAVSSRTEADPVGILGSLLSAVGVCFGHGAYLYQGSQQSANLFVALVGETASGRKGTAQSIVRETLNAAYPDWQDLIVTGLGSGEGLIAHLKRHEGSEHRALVLESEFGRLLTVMNREGSTLSPIVRDAWDGVPMGRFLARDGQLVKWHHVGLVAHITPIELRAKLRDVDAANGFGNRFLWLAVRRTQLVPFPESPRLLIQPYLGELSAAIHEAQPNRELHWTPEAAERWEALYRELTTRTVHGVPGALMARAESQIVRLALVYALLDRAPAVDVEHLRAGEALWAYAERSVGYLFGATTGNRLADALRDLLREGPLDWATARRELGVRLASELREAVDVLAEIGQIEVAVVPQQRGGRAHRILSLVDGATNPNHANHAKDAGVTHRPENGARTE